MQIPTEARGITAALAAALFTNLVMVSGKLMQGWNWPCFFLAGFASLFIALGLGILMWCQKSYHLETREVKWVLSRGLFGALNNVLNICAILAGAHIGSVAALGSVNTVVAALLGRLVLGEPLGKWHVLAILLFLVGAVLISDPREALASMGSSLLGNLLALLAGITLGFVFISARKAGQASSTLLTFSAMAQRVVACWATALLLGKADGNIESLAESPPKSMLFFLLLLLVLLLANWLSSLASKLCPAALTATLLTGGQMITGYLLDIFAFGKLPKVITLIGASLMFLAVLTMTLARLPPNTVETDSPSSLANFMAAEYAERKNVMVEDQDQEMPSGPRKRTISLDVPVGKIRL
ncbi:unnamed protein product [Durusdinium trenchii]|uniref:EamA domain-containing protein n=2 Tax=Durusdinium trenchii TaxID=1381693 RepID=A0ABP0JAW4_9DINO